MGRERGEREREKERERERKEKRRERTGSRDIVLDSNPVSVISCQVMAVAAVLLWTSVSSPMNEGGFNSLCNARSSTLRSALFFGRGPGYAFRNMNSNGIPELHL
jgi:hypothetical protein